jgi:hypothetical protein
VIFARDVKGDLPAEEGDTFYPLTRLRSTTVSFRPLAFRVLPWVPPVSLQVYPPIQEEPDALLFQEAALRAGVPDPEVWAARPALLDDPVAGNPGSSKGAVHGPPHDPG